MAKSVADIYPAHTDTNGITWYRPVLTEGIKPQMWGWTSQPQYAHEDYMCMGCFGHPSRCDCKKEES